MVAVEQRPLAQVQAFVNNIMAQLKAEGYNTDKPLQEQKITASQKRLIRQLASMGYDPRGYQIGTKESIAATLQVHGLGGDTKKKALRDRMKRAKLTKYGFPMNSKAGALAVLARKRPSDAQNAKMLQKKQVIKKLAELGYTSEGTKLNSGKAALNSLAKLDMPMVEDKEEALARLNAAGLDANAYPLGSKLAVHAALKKVQPVEPVVGKPNPDLMSGKNAVIARLVQLGYDENGNKIGSLDALLTIIRKETGQPVLKGSMTKEQAIRRVKELGYDAAGNKIQEKDKSKPWMVPQLHLDKNGNVAGTKPAIMVIAAAKKPELVPQLEQLDDEAAAEALKNAGVCPTTGFRLGSRKHMIEITRSKCLLSCTKEVTEDWQASLDSGSADRLNVHCLRKKELRKVLFENGFDHEGNPLGSKDSLKAMVRRYDSQATITIAKLTSKTELKARLSMLGVDEFGKRLGSRTSMLMVMRKKGMHTSVSDNPLQIDGKSLECRLGQAGYDKFGHRIGSKKSIITTAMSTGADLQPTAPKLTKKELVAKTGIDPTKATVPYLQPHGQAVMDGASSKLPGSATIADLVAAVQAAYPGSDLSAAQAAFQREFVLNVGDVRNMQPADWTKMGIPLGIRNRIMACV
eukprot:CAMPEP_0177655446 /NCGR_PEP_ID=MMETSP0447-20121125/14975_1 /TAXON_ID=0 /ORGANISM="Stygamoeba regulata, Strain BSH-02190019" /LENGTH=632 /DNA_ID=CAMNT_0019159373 /DNA_START=168 /DNA_END=2066 /DNA_ORIENTATION=-